MNAGLTFGRANKVPTWRELFTWPEENRVKPGESRGGSQQIDSATGDQIELNELLSLRNKQARDVDALKDAGPNFAELREQLSRKLDDTEEEILSLDRAMRARTTIEKDNKKRQARTK